MDREKLIEVVREIFHRPVPSIDKSARRGAADPDPIEHRPSLVGKRAVIRHGFLHSAGSPMRWNASSEPRVGALSIHPVTSAASTSTTTAAEAERRVDVAPSCLLTRAQLSVKGGVWLARMPRAGRSGSASEAGRRSRNPDGMSTERWQSASPATQAPCSTAPSRPTRPRVGPFASPPLSNERCVVPSPNRSRRSCGPGSDDLDDVVTDRRSRHRIHVLADEARLARAVVLASDLELPLLE